jgi:TRAP-type C4-dicarboxylate transport system permease small subunit
MTTLLHRAGPWLARWAENMAAAMLAAMFAAFLVQIVSRYLLGLPTGWTHEISAMLWVWLVCGARPSW